MVATVDVASLAVPVVLPASLSAAITEPATAECGAAEVGGHLLLVVRPLDGDRVRPGPCAAGKPMPSVAACMNTGRCGRRWFCCWASRWRGRDRRVPGCLVWLIPTYLAPALLVFQLPLFPPTPLNCMAVALFDTSS